VRVNLEGRALTRGEAEGPVAAIAPLSFWGGYDPEHGAVIDRSHPACGRSLTGTILVMSSGRGSSSSSSVLAEAIRLGTAPAAIVLSDADAILVTGALVAETLYGRACPVLVLAPAEHRQLAGARRARVVARDGVARISLADTDRTELR
jgi:predicted aconitase with swiveling domain